jgi:hypothetical protein
VVDVSDDGGLAWAEYDGSDRVHSGVNSGVVGTGWFLHDVGLATGDEAFSRARRLHGVLEFLARLEGWPVDSPGMQPGLVPAQPVRRNAG